MSLEDGDAFLVFASKAGSDRNSDWYWNLRAAPEVTIEVGAQTIEVHAAELVGKQREAKFGIQAKRYPRFAGHQRKQPDHPSRKARTSTYLRPLKVGHSTAWKALRNQRVRCDGWSVCEILR